MHLFPLEIRYTLYFYAENFHWPFFLIWGVVNYIIITLGKLFNILVVQYQS